MHASKKSPAVQQHKTLALDYVSTHREIVEKCKSGNRRAQFELYRLYSKAMYNVCLRMVRQEQDAEDLLQNAFVDVFTKLDSFRYQSSIGAWIKRIVVNNCINHLKRNRLLVEELNESGSEIQAEDELPIPGLSVEVVKKALEKLPDGYRVVFSLYLLEGYDHKEIAEILDITEATSKSQYSRAKKKVRDLIIEEQSFKECS
ncbi:MAG TPA: RNA polymerase sigma factor [Saprospiraceae bacterium]|nr:RNA polymerase sigma factor [Saprospiraceae bacterium]HMQ84024.1 RNA polymerase sigma factor [Saprospiraceae bacterium]